MSPYLAKISSWIGQRTDDLDLLDNRARPSVRDDQRKRLRILRTHMDEMNVEPIDRRHELRQGVEPGFDPAPVVIGSPIACECAHGRELHALGCIRYRFPLRKLCRGDALTKVNQCLLGNVHPEG